MSVSKRSLGLLAPTCLWIGCLLPVCAGQAQDAPKRMDEVVQSYVNAKQFMGSVLVARDGNILLDKGYGDANLEWQIPDSPEAKFRLGSITKQFTAASILLLEERGKLRTDDLVKKHLPDAPQTWDKVTIYNLLTHTSGIPNFTSFPDYRSRRQRPRSSWRVSATSRWTSSPARSGVTAIPATYSWAT